MLFNGQTFSGVFEQFFFYSKVFGVKNAKIDLFKEKMVLRVVFIKLTFMWSQIGLYHLINTKQLEFSRYRTLTIYNVFFEQ